MIVDADVHISPFREDGRISVEELISIIERAGVDKALTWLHPHYFRDVDVGNRYIYEATRKFPDRILGFGWVDPHYGVEQAIESVRRCVDEYGFWGVKLNGAQNEFYIDHEEFVLPVIEAIAQSGKLIAFHIGTDAYDQTHPFRLAKIARRFPELKILAVHMGGVAHRDLSHAMIEVAQDHPNIFLIGSAVRTGAILRAIKILGAQRVCFGSDTPFEVMPVEVARYKAILAEVKDEQTEDLVMGLNILRLLGLS